MSWVLKEFRVKSIVRKSDTTSIEMNSVKISVVIPTYNQAAYLGEAVKSVLNQTFSNLEVIVVDDASTDETSAIMRRIGDPRVKYIVHENNRYAAAARNTGIRASSGELLAFLDADDLMFPSKLQKHLKFLQENPGIGLSYSHRLTIDEHGNPLAIETSPTSVELKDLVVGYPFAPSDIVMRRESAFRVDLFDESFLFNAEDPDFHMRLALDGCRMAGIDQVLNYRRLHTGRVFRNLPKVISDQLRAFENTFSDVRCSPEVQAIRHVAFGRLYLSLSFLAFFQNEAELGRELVLTSLRYDRTILDSEAKTLRTSLSHAATRTDGDHELRLERVFAQLPPQLDCLRQHLDDTVAKGYIIRGSRDVIWGRTESGIEHLEKAVARGAELDEPTLSYLTTLLMRHATYLGDAPSETILETLVAGLAKAKVPGSLRRLNACYWVNQAFESYRSAGYSRVPKQLAAGVANSPAYLFNRGVLSIFFRSLLRLPTQVKKSVVTGLLGLNTIL
jgi:glycosyltransferase involved in cell wall biosynthesis